MTINVSTKEIARAVRVCGGNYNAASKVLGIPRGTIWNRLNRDQRVFSSPETPDLIFPDFPDEDVSIEEVIDLKCKSFEKRKASYDAHTWFPVQVRDDKPIGILWFGDPHLDDNGANWPALRHHANLCATTEGLYGANIGDTTNNWSGRLVKLYANQDASVKTARRLAEWLMVDAGIPWLVWILGNHDAWGDGSDILARMAQRLGTTRIVMHDWEARFVLHFPGGETIRIYAAHDFPGNSMWNPLHGPTKSAMFGNQVDLLVCGHKHHWAIGHWELSDQGSCPVLVRARGYKYMDDYARRIGKVEQEEGSSILTIIDPKARTPAGRVTAFADIDAGVDFLTWKRNKA